MDKEECGGLGLRLEIDSEDNSIMKYYILYIIFAASLTCSKAQRAADLLPPAHNDVQVRAQLNARIQKALEKHALRDEDTWTAYVRRSRSDTVNQEQYFQVQVFITPNGMDVPTRLNGWQWWYDIHPLRYAAVRSHSSEAKNYGDWEKPELSLHSSLAKFAWDGSGPILRVSRNIKYDSDSWEVRNYKDNVKGGGTELQNVFDSLFAHMQHVDLTIEQAKERFAIRDVMLADHKNANETKNRVAKKLGVEAGEARISDDVDYYLTLCDKLTLDSCPTSFRRAFEKHVEAWRKVDMEKVDTKEVDDTWQGVEKECRKYGVGSIAELYL